MRNKKRYFLGIYLLIAASAFAATTHYVSLSGTNNSPYLNWADSATNLKWAVGASTEGDTVMVSNGTYWVTNVITVASSLTIQSLKGRDVTILNGFRPTSTNRCFFVQPTASANIIDGFTITNFYVKGTGASAGGALYIYGTIRNCIISGNNSDSHGGGLLLNTGAICSNCIVRCNSTGGGGGGFWVTGASGIKVVDCLIENNTATSYGGGISLYQPQNITVSNCTIVNNIALIGGGIYVYNKGPIYIDSCAITGNVARGSEGGGMLVDRMAIGHEVYVNHCHIIGNNANNIGGGINGSRYFLKNSVVANNQALTNGGGLFISTGIVESCTVVSNYVGVSGGGLYIDGPAVGTNNIIYHNTAVVSANNFTNTAGNTGLNYCCVFPAVDGNGNITNDPSLKNLAGGDYHLNNNSPCVNRGMNQGWMTGVLDLDGRMRIRYGTVDMGAYERINNGGIYRFH